MFGELVDREIAASAATPRELEGKTTVFHLNLYILPSLLRLFV